MTTAKGNVFVISAASGTGKTTLVSRLTAHNPNIRVSVSHTTRAPRENEQHGKHYYFTTREHFTELVKLMCKARSKCARRCPKR